ncbi:2TM domain-containing protein [Nocardia sp. NPDC005998]|uniref:2TM domain-containing protein n=1 Tax=Nocardia sp. NPDC005998 TaxID=3156894 RepID=UPI00339F57BE
MIAVIIGCEIGFWALLLLGLAVRYLTSARQLSTILLACVPLVDVVLLAVSVIDLRTGGQAGTAHGLAAIYIGVSVAFGPQMIDWADQRFAYRFAGGPRPERPPKTGRAHAARERSQWFRHLAAYVVAAGVLAVFTLLVGDTARTAPLWMVLGPWGIVVVIDFLISFSYTFAPRREKSS